MRNVKSEVDKMSFFENTRKPGAYGKIMVAMMNLGQQSCGTVGTSLLKLTPDAKVLDCGCGRRGRTSRDF